jgi:pimeloyl-ACP methyl ester carboxylesterase
VTTDTDELEAREQRGEYGGLIDGLRERVQSNSRTLADPWVKRWCGRRWRDLFISEAARDEKGLSAAARRISVPGTGLSIRAGPDSRSERQRIAERFLHRDTEDWRLELPPSKPGPIEHTTLVFCPGLVSTLIPVAGFGAAFPALEERYGWRIIRAAAHPVRGCEANVADLLDAVERGNGLDAAGLPIPAGEARPPEDVVLLGYSKGAADALTLLIRHPELSDRVKALVCWCGAVGGSFLADDVYAAIKDVDVPLGPASDMLRSALKALLPVAQLDNLAERLDEWDLKTAVRDLTTAERCRILDEHAEEIDALDIPIFNVAAVAGPLEVPYFQLQGSVDIARRAGDNDMQLTVEQSCMTIPMATDLAVLHAHHWDVSYDAFPVHLRLGAANLDHLFPREAAATAIYLLLAELGLIA